MAEESLKHKTRKGLYWSAAGNFANQGMRFLFGVILARLLSPDAYGIVGMLSIFMCIVSTFIDCGFSRALITKQDRTQKDFSTEFWFNIVVGIVGYLILFIASPFIADFYNMPILSPVLKIIGLGVIINSLCVVQTAQFAIRLDFKTPAKISVFNQMISGVVGIILAYCGWGIWALVFQQVAGNILNAICLWTIVRWIPSFEFSKESFKYLWNFGSKVLGASLLSQIYDNIQPLIIGKAYSSHVLGLYSRAQGFATLPSSNLSGIFGNVTFPILSKINDDIPRMTQIYRKMIKVSGFVVFPMMVLLAALSDPIVRFLLNEQWYGCIPLLVIVSFSLMWQPISYINLSLLNAAKHPEIVLKLELIKKPMGLIVLLVSSQFGIITFAFGNLFICVFAVFVNTLYTSRCLNVSFLNQVRDLTPSFLISMLSGLITYLIVLQIKIPLLSLIISGSIGVTIYLLLARLFMYETLKETLSLIKRKA